MIHSLLFILLITASKRTPQEDCCRPSLHIHEHTEQNNITDHLLYFIMLSQRLVFHAQSKSKTTTAAAAARRALSSHSSPPSPPRFQIPAHVATFSLLLIPALIMFVYAERYGPSEEELESRLRERYKDQIQEQSQHNEAMRRVFQSTIQHPDGSVDKQLDEILRAGKEKRQRLLPVNEKLFGTRQGVVEKERMQKELLKEQREKKEKRELRRKNKGQQEKGNASIKSKQKATNTTTSRHDDGADDDAGDGSNKMVIDAKSVVAVTAIAGLAAAVGFLAGGSRRQ